MDREKPLNKRGNRDAPMMGLRLLQSGIRIDLIVTSPAKRALTTAKKIAKQFSFKIEMVQEEKLYDATEWQILEVIHSLDDKIENVMIVAHNPGITDLVNQISGHRIEKVPTCGVALLRYDSDTWQEVGRAKPVAFEFDYPKQTPGFKDPGV